MSETKQKMHKGKLALIWCGFVILVGILIFLLLSAFGALRFWQAEKTPQGETDLAFEATKLSFVHKADLVNSLPFLASAAFDINGDGQDELFLGGGDEQPDEIFAYRNNQFEKLPLTFAKDAVDATHGAASMDIDNDGDTDLFTARESGIWFHENTNGQFGSVNLGLDLADNTVPLSIGFGDINNDGLADMYIAGYIKIALVEGETIFSDNYGGFSYLFLNEGNGAWRDISKDAGVWRQHNTFLGVFADLDNDKDSDLIIAQDTGHVEMYSNNGDMTFTPIENPSVNSYPMGVAVGDYDNDGLVDLYFSNVGYTLPPVILRGDLKKDDPFNPSYMLFHNDGGLKFSDTSEQMNAAKYGFGWGTVMADMNLDGLEDMLAAQNYARFPANDLLQHYPGKILQNYGDTFKPVEKVSGAENRLFGISPIVSDFNSDGWPDLVWANLDGQSLAYINKGGDRKWIKVRLPNMASSLGARVTVVAEGGLTQTKQLITSQGLGSDQGRDLIFGLGDAQAVKSVTIEFQNGTTKRFDAPKVGSVITASAQ
ncbi:MAG: CRTAC1 family protein [Litorimonas sp.]